MPSYKPDVSISTNAPRFCKAKEKVADSSESATSGGDGGYSPAGQATAHRADCLRPAGRRPVLILTILAAKKAPA